MSRKQSKSNAEALIAETSSSKTNQVITAQPQVAGFLPQNMARPALSTIPLNCPPGLEYLLLIDQLLIQQKVEILETITGFETNNQYYIRNSFGQEVYLASEDTDCCTRNCCGSNRPFDMRIVDHSSREVLHVYRPLRCDCCCCPCCLQYVQVEAPPGTIIGYIIQDWSCLASKYHIENSTGETILRIEGPICTYSILCEDVEFDVLARDQYIRVGRITKQWSGLLREAFTDADFFGVVFPMDLDVNMKACLLAATFLIVKYIISHRIFLKFDNGTDFMFFEKKQNKERDRPGMLEHRGFS